MVTTTTTTTNARKVIDHWSLEKKTQIVEQVSRLNGKRKTKRSEIIYRKQRKTESNFFTLSDVNKISRLIGK